MATRPTISQQRQVEALVKKLEPQIEQAFLQAIAQARNTVDTAKLIEALKAGNIEQAVQLLRIDQSILYPLDDAIRGAYIAGGMTVAPNLPTAIRGSFGFNGRHPRAESWIRAEGGTLIQGIADDTLTMARNVITEAMAAGQTAPTIARSLTGRVVAGERVGGFLGLTTQQADSIASGRAKLLSGDPALMREYLDLKLRNRNYDAMIRRAVDGKGKLSAADVDKIIEAHKTKALGYRGKVIAKDQAFTAQAAGRMEGYRQVLDRGDVDGVSVRWSHGLSEFPRPDHVAMDGTVVQLGETFNFPDGTRMTGPHDPAGGAKHSLGCRCIAIYRPIVSKD